MVSKIMDILSKLHSSYWFIPLLMAISAFFLSIFTIYLDQMALPNWLASMGWALTNKPENAATFLSTIATSIITVAGVVFSMTIVAVSFAASQIGPRLISNFMRDKSNQVTLGIFISIFLYCLFILLALFNLGGDGTSKPFIPQISLMVALFLTLIGVGALIFFIHHTPESINISYVIARVGEELTQQIDCLFPSKIGYAGPIVESISSDRKKHDSTVTASCHGYIRILDGASLINIACKYDLLIEIKAKPGDYIVEDEALLIIHAKETINETLKKECIKVFAFGAERNQEQDILFFINEMVEIIARALSPSMNDPFTAMTCMNWLQLFLHKLAKTPIPSNHRYDKSKQLRIIAPTLSFGDFCNLIFSRIRPYVCKDKNATLHMMKIIHQINKTIVNAEYKALLIAHAISLKNAALSCQLSEDIKDINRLFQRYFGQQVGN
ncbi:MAG: DUF2254 domain-containing protein [Tatlockia sp.]|nr:DUF2254 domain-containing protein [Tatlockia sp.]